MRLREHVAGPYMDTCAIKPARRRPVCLLQTYVPVGANTQPQQVSSKAASNRLKRWKAAAQFAPATAATGGFPYNLRSVAECDPHRRKCDHTKCRPCDYGCDDAI